MPFGYETDENLLLGSYRFLVWRDGFFGTEAIIMCRI